MNRYYLGSSEIANYIARGKDSANTHSTIDGAIEEARKRCEKNDDTVIIVQIVAIVRREKPPITITKFDEDPN